LSNFVELKFNFLRKFLLHRDFACHCLHTGRSKEISPQIHLPPIYLFFVIVYRGIKFWLELLYYFYKTGQHVFVFSNY